MNFEDILSANKLGKKLDFFAEQKLIISQIKIIPKFQAAIISRNQIYLNEVFGMQKRKIKKKILNLKTLKKEPIQLNKILLIK